MIYLAVLLMAFQASATGHRFVQIVDSYDFMEDPWGREHIVYSVNGNLHDILTEGSRYLGCEDEDGFLYPCLTVRFDPDQPTAYLILDCMEEFRVGDVWTFHDGPSEASYRVRTIPSPSSADMEPYDPR
jgi:hypothetical protein